MSTDVLTPPSTVDAEKERLEALRVQHTTEIERRGGETEIVGKYGVQRVTVAHEDPTPGSDLVLMRAEGWRHYSSRVPARWVQLAYLCGTDDGHPFAVRVPGTTPTVRGALYALTPAVVSNAVAAGKRVKRQGDVYAIETTKQHDGKGLEDLPESHRWNPATRYMTHAPEDGRKHRPLRVVWPARWVRQTAYEMGRSGARGGAD